VVYSPVSLSLCTGGGVVEEEGVGPVKKAAAAAAARDRQHNGSGTEGCMDEDLPSPRRMKWGREREINPHLNSSYTVPKT